MIQKNNRYKAIEKELFEDLIIVYGEKEIMEFSEHASIKIEQLIKQLILELENL